MVFAQVSEPVPGEHALGPGDQVVAKGFMALRKTSGSAGRLCSKTVLPWAPLVYGQGFGEVTEFFEISTQVTVGLGVIRVESQLLPFRLR